MVKKHPDVAEAGDKIDISDLQADPILKFQEKYYLWLMPIFCFVLPTIVPVLFWNESWKISFISGCLRYVLSVNITWGINSVCHLWGYKPYDKSMGSRQSLFMALTALGEGNCAMNGTLLSKPFLLLQVGTIITTASLGITKQLSSATTEPI